MENAIQQYKNFIQAHEFQKIHAVDDQDYDYEVFCNKKGVFIGLEISKKLEYGCLRMRSLVRDWRIIKTLEQFLNSNHRLDRLDGFVLTSADGIANTIVSSSNLVMNKKNLSDFKEMVSFCNDFIKGPGIYAIEEVSCLFKNKDNQNFAPIEFLENRSEWIEVRSNRNFGLVRDYDALGWDSPPLSVQKRYKYWYQQCFVNWEDPLNIKNSAKNFRKEEGLSFDLWLWRSIPDLSQANRAWEFFKDKSLEEKKILMNTIYPNGQTFACVFFEKCSDFLLDDFNEHRDDYEEQLRKMLLEMGPSEIKVDSSDFSLIENMKKGKWIDNRYFSYEFSNTVWKILRELKIMLKIPENCMVEKFQENLRNKFHNGQDSKAPGLEMNEKMKYLHFLGSDFMEKHLQSKISPSQIINKTIPQFRF